MLYNNVLFNIVAEPYRGYDNGLKCDVEMTRINI
jgi:hypothetical protein